MDHVVLGGSIEATMAAPSETQTIPPPSPTLVADSDSTGRPRKRMRETFEEEDDTVDIETEDDESETIIESGPWTGFDEDSVEYMLTEVSSTLICSFCFFCGNVDREVVHHRFLRDCPYLFGRDNISEGFEDFTSTVEPLLATEESVFGKRTGRGVNKEVSCEWLLTAAYFSFWEKTIIGLDAFASLGPLDEDTLSSWTAFARWLSGRLDDKTSILRIHALLYLCISAFC